MKKIILLSIILLSCCVKSYAMKVEEWIPTERERLIQEYRDDYKREFRSSCNRLTAELGIEVPRKTWCESDYEQEIGEFSDQYFLMTSDAKERFCLSYMQYHRLKIENEKMRIQGRNFMWGVNVVSFIAAPLALTMGLMTSVGNDQEKNKEVHIEDYETTVVQQLESTPQAINLTEEKNERSI